MSSGCGRCVQFPERDYGLSAMVRIKSGFRCCCSRGVSTSRTVGGVGIVVGNRIVTLSRDQCGLPRASALACCVSDVIRFLSQSPGCGQVVISQRTRAGVATCVACNIKSAGFVRSVKGGGTRVSHILRALRSLACDNRLILSDIGVVTATSPRKSGFTGGGLSKLETGRLGRCLVGHASSARDLTLFGPCTLKRS